MIFNVWDEGAGEWPPTEDSHPVLRLMHLPDRGWKINFTRFASWPLFIFSTSRANAHPAPSDAAACSRWIILQLEDVLLWSSLLHSTNGNVLEAVKRLQSRPRLQREEGWILPHLWQIRTFSSRNPPRIDSGAQLLCPESCEAGGSAQSTCGWSSKHCSSFNSNSVTWRNTEAERWIHIN